MSYDTWKTEAEETAFTEPEPTEFDEQLEAWFDEETIPNPDDLQYRTEVTERLVEAIEDYLQFASHDELIRLIGENL